MSAPKATVVIPAYNGADFLGEAIESVLGQTYRDFELIVVDDASQDETPEVVCRFSDRRVRYFAHQKNRGAVAARQTGTELASGEIIAYLDQDDLFHREKLEAHVSFLDTHPEVGLTYNARFEVRDASRTICGLWRPPSELTLTELVAGFPISPSDTVLRRAWAVRREIWEHAQSETGEVVFNGHEIVLGGRLALAGCRSAVIDRALNYRRYHANRKLSRLEARCRAELACQEMILRDPRCPDEVRAVRNVACSNILFIWAYQAFVQGEPDLGRRWLSEAVEIRPDIVGGDPCELVHLLAATAAADCREPHEVLLKRVLGQLPVELRSLERSYDWAVARGYLLRGTRAVIWGRLDEGSSCLIRAAALEAAPDEALVLALGSELLAFDAEFGAATCRRVLDALTSSLKEAGFGTFGRRLAANYWLNRGFHAHRLGNRRAAAASAARAVAQRPRFAFNRGVLSVLVRGIYGGSQ